MRDLWSFVHRVGALLLPVVLVLLAGRLEEAPMRLDVEPAVAPEPTPEGDSVIEARAEMPAGQFVLGPGRKLPVTLQGLDTVTLRLFRVPVAFVHHVQGVVGIHRHTERPLDQLPLGTAVEEQRVVLRPDGPTFRSSEVRVDVFAHVKGDLALAVLEAPHMTRVALIERGRLALLVKKGLGEGLVWVSDTQTAKPAAKAWVTVRQGGKLRFRGKTDERGLLALPNDDALRIPFDGGDPDSYQPLVVVAEHHGHVGLDNEHWSTGLEPWSYGIPAAYYSTDREYAGMVTAERGIYRPSETAHVFGVLRKRGKSGALSVATGKAALTVRAPDGNVAFDGAVELTPFGTFQVPVPLGRHAALGRYGITLRRDATALHGGFEVGEYRTARFEVELSGIEGAAGGTSVSARYLYGAPVKEAETKWSASVREGRSPVLDGFEYGPEDSYGYLSEIASGKGVTDADGRLAVRVDAAALPDATTLPAQILDVVHEATVTDAAGDAISGTRVEKRLRSPAVVGVRSNDWIVDPARGWSVDVKTIDAHGKSAPGQRVTLEVVRRYWAAVAKVRGGRRVYDGRWREEVAVTKTLQTTATARAVRFELPGGGTYRLRARIAGAEAYAETSVWAYGGGAYGGGDESARIELRSDREQYAPGDTARLLVGSPFTDALGLVTVERDGVLHAEVRRIASGDEIRLPMRDAYMPGAYASVALLPVGLGKAAPSAGIPFRMGYTKLGVSAEKKHLSVSLTPDAAEHRPGDHAKVGVRVRDARGRPVRAEVTLWAADEGVLMLTGYRTPNVFGAVYEERPLGVFTSTNMVRWYQEGQDYDDGSGGDYGGEGSAMRSRFLSTAFFAKPVVTDATGRASVEFELPDNLTRWRLMASATDAGDRFGSAEASMTASKPVQVMPALPRFVTRGDRVQATVLVQNQTARGGEAVVAVDVEGARLVGDHEKRVRVDAGAQVAVPFSLEADRIGTVTVSARARLGRERDGFRVELPSHPPATWQSRVVASGELGAGAQIAMQLPPDARPDETEVTIDVSAGVLSGMSGAIDALLDYPHGCVEQTTSRLIPLVQLERILEKTGDPRLSSAQHRGRMNDAIAHVLRHQNDDGGFGLWPISESESFLTAYALWGLSTAEKAGYEVPVRVTRRGFRYLREHLGKDHDMHGQFSEEEVLPFAAYVMALADEVDTGNPSLSGEDASRFSQGLLGVASVKQGQVGVAWAEGAKQGQVGVASATRAKAGVDATLAALLAASQPVRSGGRLVRERGRAHVFAMGRDVRATSTALEALLAAGRSSDADELAAGILATQLTDGTWGTTYNNLWALNALAAYASAQQGQARSSTVVITQGSERRAEATVSGDAPLRRVVVSGKLAFAGGKRATLVLSGPKGSSVRYVARLRWVPDVARQRAVTNGYSVSRSLVDAETNQPITTPRVGQLLRVKLQVVADETRQQIAVVDALPAGLEPIDTALRTSGNLAAKETHGWYWSHRELHDERVTFFADYLPAGTHDVSYLARATRAGTFVRPAMRAEAMYDPDVVGIGTAETVVVSR